MPADPTLTFDRYRLDLPNEQIWQDDQLIALTNKAFAVLRYLVEHAGQLVTKAELFDTLWSGTAVSDGALTFCIVELRKALGDDAKAPRFIETVHRRGYRFLGKVVSSPHSVVSSPPSAHSALSPESSALRLRGSRCGPHTISQLVRESRERRAPNCLRDGRAGDW